MNEASPYMCPRVGGGGWCMGEHTHKSSDRKSVVGSPTG